GLVVGGYRYREPSQRTTDGAKLLDQLLGVVALAPRPYEMTGQVARQRDRGQVILGDRVHRHAEPAEGADDAQAAGVNRGMAALDEERGHRAVNLEGGSACVSQGPTSPEYGCSDVGESVRTIRASRPPGPFAGRGSRGWSAARSPAASPPPPPRARAA